MEVAAGSNFLAAEQGVNGLRLGFSLHRNEVEFEDRKFFLSLLPGSRSDDDRNAIKFCLAFQTCCNVDRVPENRIVKAQVRPNIADNASTCVDANADAKRQEGLAGTGFLVHARD